MATEYKSFYIFGDSICFGQHVSPHRIWINKLSADLHNVFHREGKKIAIQNASINGHTTRQALERIGYDVTSHQCDYLLIQFGMNDCNYWATDKGVPRVGKKAFAANMEEIVERALANNTEQFFIQTNHPSLKGGFSHMKFKTYDESNEEYSDIIRTTCIALVDKGYPVHCVDIERAWLAFLKDSESAKLSDLLLNDGIHLSELGHELYAKISTPFVLNKIKELQA